VPELPEVETIKRGLQDKIIGKVIQAIDVLGPRRLIGKREDVVGRKILAVDRRAKVLRVQLSGGTNLLFHLKMTGQLIYRPEIRNTKYEIRDSFAGGHPSHDWHADLPNSATRLVFTFDDKAKLFFNDLRMFGWCKVLTDEQVAKIFMDEYGPEPIDSDSGQALPDFTVPYLAAQAKRLPRRKIKQFLTDQKIIAGIGNIYADESLFAARISPLRPVKEISPLEWQNLRQSVVEILGLAIKNRGTTDSDYVDSEGKKGGMQNFLKVYRRDGQPCPENCGGLIERITLGGRGTHYCPACQK
jgi:formamidopyrimidine-DNA glycosylase